jgi:hypothetical protein
LHALATCLIAKFRPAVQQWFDWFCLGA